MLRRIHLNQRRCAERGTNTDAPAEIRGKARVVGENMLDVRIAEDVPAPAGVIEPDGLLGAHLLKPAVPL